LSSHRGDIVTRVAQKLQTATPDILIELKFHAALLGGTGMMRSRAASAP
jgi:hypothetical protein